MEEVIVPLVAAGAVVVAEGVQPAMASATTVNEHMSDDRTRMDPPRAARVFGQE